MSHWLPIAELAKQVQGGAVTAESLVNRSLELIEGAASYNAILWSLPKAARQRAADIDKRIKAGEAVGPLAGVPFIAKDNFLVRGAETTAASNILKGFEGVYQSSVIERLEEAGAICVAKANLDAFAHGSSTENSDFMLTKNPVDPTRVPGGSSGGSGSAIGLDLAPFALGTDTGGSIRQPAAFCGIVGYKPSYGLVSRSGVVAMSSSSDVIGPMTRTVEDAALVMDIIAGKDHLDSTTIERDPKPYATATADLKGKKFGLVEQHMGEGIDEDVKARTEQAVERLRQAGAVVEPVSLPSLSLALAVYYIVVPAEVASNLSRYDGQRYGYTAPNPGDLEQSYKQTRAIGFGKEAKRRIIIGTYVLSSGYYDAYYKRAQLVRTKIVNEFAEAFETYDFLIGPTAPSVAFKPGDKHTPLQMYLNDLTTTAANMAGVPAISVPNGLSHGLPVGLQIMGQARQDRELLAIAKRIEETL